MSTYGTGTYGAGTYGGILEAPGTVRSLKRPSLTPSFTLGDGQPVRLFDWQCDVTADWGDRSLTGKLNTHDAIWAEQGMPIIGWLGSDRRLWTGEVTQDPRRDGDAWAIKAHGPAEHLAEVRRRMFYRIDGAEQWVERDAEPHEIGNDNKFELTLKRSLMKWRFGNGGIGSFSAGNGAGFCIWVEGGLITRYSVLSNPDATYAAFDLNVHRFAGPSGARTLVASHSLNIGSPQTRVNNVSNSQDALQFIVEANTGATADARRTHVASQIKVYGRTKDDEFSVSDVVTDVAKNAGLGTENISQHSLGALPLDWTEDHPDLLSYMAELTDWRWLARGDGIHFGPYERTWTVFGNRDAVSNLDTERRYNRVIVPYEALSGARRESTPAEPTVDPFPGREVIFYADELEDPQPNSSLADQMAAAKVEHLAQRNVRGPVDLINIRDEQGIRNPYEAVAGDLIKIPDSALPPQRISTVSYAPEERVTAEIGLTFNPVRALLTARRPRRRRRRRR